MLRTKNIFTSKQAKNREFIIFLSNILPGTGILLWEMHLETALRDSCGKEKNTNQKVFLSIKNCLVYNIMWLGKPNLFSLELNLDLIWTMSFFNQRVIYYLIDQFNVWLLIVYIKKPAILKHQWFNNNESEEMTSRKPRRFDKHDNEEEQGLDENENEFEGNRYVLFPSSTLPSLPQKKSNFLSDLDKQTKSLIYLVYISKNC